MYSVHVKLYAGTFFLKISFSVDIKSLDSNIHISYNQTTTIIYIILFLQYSFITFFWQLREKEQRVDRENNLYVQDKIYSMHFFLYLLNE